MAAITADLIKQVFTDTKDTDVTGLIAALTDDRLNGTVEVGIAANADPSLDEARKLQIVHPEVNANVTRDVIARLTMAGCMMAGANEESDLDKLRCWGAYVAVRYGWVCSPPAQSEYHGDVNVVRTITGVAPVRIDKAYITANLRWQGLAALAIVATKINWWSTNHHTGDENRIMTGFPRKVAEIIDPEYARSSNETIKAMNRTMHQIGHWCCTRRVLSSLGIPNIQVGDCLPIVPGGHDPVPSVTLLNDVTLRLTGFPSGTARLSLSYEMARQMLIWKYAPFIPNVNDFTIIFREYKKIYDPANGVDDRAYYHQGAYYLTGEKQRVWNAPTCLGRGGLYLEAYKPYSTLLDSPIMKGPGGIKRYENEEDADATFKSSIAVFRNAAAANIKKLPKVAIQSNVMSWELGNMMSQYYPTAPINGMVTMWAGITGTEKELERYVNSQTGAYEKVQDGKTKEKGEESSEGE